MKKQTYKASWSDIYSKGHAAALAKIQYFQGAWSKHLTEEQAEIVANPLKAADGGPSMCTQAKRLEEAVEVEQLNLKEGN